MSTQNIKDPIRYATLIAGRIPNNSEITGLYEANTGAKWAVVKLHNGQVVAFCGGVMRRFDQRKVVQKNNRYYESTITSVRHIPLPVVTKPIPPDAELTR